MRRILTISSVLVLLAGTAAAQGTFGETLREAHLQLDIGNPRAAVELYEKALGMRRAAIDRVAPERAWSYVVLGNEALRSADYAKAEAAYGMAAAVHGQFKGVFIEQWVYATLRRVNDELSEAVNERTSADWKSLESSLNWAVKSSEGNRYAIYTLAVLHDLNHNHDKARAWYARLLDKRPHPDTPLENIRERARAKISNLQHSFDLRPVYPPWHEASRDLQTLNRGPFVISHHNADLAERVAAVLEYHLSRSSLDGILPAGGPFPEVCNVFIFADEADFRESGGQEVWTGGRAKLMTQDDRLVGVQIHLYQTVPELTESAVPHELAHVRLLATAPYVQGLPLWLQEGVATAQESEYKKEVLAEAVQRTHENGALVPFEDLMEAKTYPANGPRDAFYGQCLAAVESLVERNGRDYFWRFVEALEDMGQDRALRMVYGLSPADVDALILEWTDARI